MKKTLVNPPQLAKPRGFNHGILVRGGRLLFLAGQDASESDGSITTDDLCDQFRRILQNFRAVLREAGGEPQHITKLNIFVSDREEYIARLGELGRIYKDEFGSDYPAMALFEVSGFFNPAARIELEGFAVLPEEAEE